MGLVDLLRRPAAGLCGHVGIAAPILLIALAPGAGPCARRRIWRCRDLRGRACADGNKRGYYTSFIQTTATVGLFLSLLVILFTRTAMGEAASPPGAGAFRSCVSVLPARNLGLDPARLNESPVFQKMKDEGNTSKRPLTEAFAELAQRQDRAPRLVRRRPWAKAWSGTPASSMRCSFCTHPQGRQPHRQPADRVVADCSAPASSSCSAPVGQDRPQADHPGGLPDRGADLLPDLQG